MKAIFLLITLVFLFSLGIGVLAQETELPEPGLTPDSPFYFIERAAEAIGTFFTFGDLKKAERYAVLATERLAEAKAVVEKGKPELVEKTMERYENHLNKSIARAEKAMEEDKNTEKATEFVAKIGKTTYIHLDVLAEVYEKVPEEAKPAIENAMKASVKRHEKVVKALRAENALGEVPGVVSLPIGVPQEVRERIQIKAQEELIVEKALQSSESSRELCTNAGGPPEMCDKIPVDGFESFEALKTFFIGVGAPAEQWALIESKCKELGATEPDECFRLLLMSSSQGSYTEVKVVPAPAMTEEEMEARRIQEAVPARVLTEEEMEESRIRAEENRAPQIEERTINAPVEYIENEE